MTMRSVDDVSESFENDYSNIFGSTRRSDKQFEANRRASRALPPKFTLISGSKHLIMM